VRFVDKVTVPNISNITMFGDLLERSLTRRAGLSASAELLVWL